MSSTSLHKYQTLLKSFCDDIDCDWLRPVANKKFAALISETSTEHDFLVNVSYKSASFPIIIISPNTQSKYQTR